MKNVKNLFDFVNKKEKESRGLGNSELLRGNVFNNQRAHARERLPPSKRTS
jgi:hypothetical protein